MEASMPSGITQLFIGMVVAIGMALVGVSAIGGAAELERAQANTPGISTGHVEPDADARLSDRQQLRRLFFDERERLR